MISIKIIRFFFLFLISFLFVAYAQAATYYVDFDNGNDNNNGLSTNSPWKTLPGTKNIGNTAYVTTSYGGGIISTTNKVSAGTIFVMKLGTIHDSSDGGRIYMSSGGGEFYNDYTSASPVTFTVDESWGTGQVVIDGTGFPTALPNIYIRVDGIKWDGVSTYKIKIQDAPRQGLLYYHHTDGSTTDDVVVKYVEFYNNGTECTTGGNECLGPGQLQVRHSDNVTFQYLQLDGNHNHISGISLGETNQRVTNGTVDNVIVFNHDGDDPPNDTGIGFKAQNSQITYTNSTSHTNLKGWDNGQQGTTEYTITYKIINSQSYNNGYSGISMNNKGGAFNETTYPVKYYIINSIIRDNGKYGIEHYAGPYLTHIVHNIIDNNGGSWTNQCGGNIRVGPVANGQDNQTVKAYIYNNAFYKPADNSNICEFHHDSDGQAPAGGTDFSLYSDYNSWRQSGIEDQFAMFAFSKDGGLGDTNSTYTYADVGNVSGNWYLRYSNTTEPEPPLYGIGHYHADEHSITTEPPFTNVATNDYTLTTSYAGLDISGQSWYISEMGTDRNGVARSGIWDIGAYEYIASGPPSDTTPPTAPTGLTVQ